MSSHRLRPIDEAILKELALCRFLTIKQIRNRFFSHGSYTHVSVLLKLLAADDFLTCLKPKAANQPVLYGLGKRGVRFLREAGMENRYFPSEHIFPSSLHLAHLLTTNDFLIAVARFCENTSGVVLVERRHYLTTPQKNRRVIPDAWLHLLVQNTECALWSELDLGSEEQDYLRRKISAILNYALFEHSIEFGVPLLAIAFITTRGGSRLEKLVRWTEQELTETRKTAYADVFRFTQIPATNDVGLDPHEFFYTKQWRQPFSVDCVSLL